MKSNRCYLLIGNSRWHWAIEQAEKWDFFHTIPNLQKLSSQEITLVAWAAVGPIPQSASFRNAKRLVTKDIPIKKLPHWVGIDRALASWAALKKKNQLHSKQANYSSLMLAQC